jgi:hypothetical protein
MPSATITSNRHFPGRHPNESTTPQERKTPASTTNASPNHNHGRHPISGIHSSTLKPPLLTALPTSITSSPFLRLDRLKSSPTPARSSPSLLPWRGTFRNRRGVTQCPVTVTKSQSSLQRELKVSSLPAASSLIEHDRTLS